MSATQDFDSITVEQLRSIGGIKWSAFPDHIGAFVAEMDFGIAPSITGAINSAVENGLFGYLPSRMGTAMSEACAAWQKANYGWDIAPENIRPLPDVLAAFDAAIDHYSAPGSKIILPTPAYMPFFKIPATHGRDIIEVPMIQTAEGWELDYDGLEQAFADGGGLLVMCNPHNPIGKVYTETEMLRVAAIVDKYSGRVFSDEIHSPLVFSEFRHIPYASVSSITAGHTLTATSASKAWNLPGLKTAQLILSNEADMDKWAQIGMFAEHGASNLGVVANTAAYSAGGPWLDEVTDYLDGNRRLLGELLTQHLPEIGYQPPQGTYLALLDCRGLGLGDHPSEFFHEHAGIAFTDGAACGQAGRGFIRINFATPRPVLTRIVLQMKEALAKR
jgi:cysteine-S-conjugate beta-lyase